MFKFWSCTELHWAAQPAQTYYQMWLVKKRYIELGFWPSKNPHLYSDWLWMKILKSVHFKNPVTQSSFLSKALSFCWLCFDFTENDNTFERNEDRVTGFLKWTNFRCYLFLSTLVFSNSGQVLKRLKSSTTLLSIPDSILPKSS